MFNINGRDIPIVHRIIKVHEKEPGAAGEDVLILTKVGGLLCIGRSLTGRVSTISSLTARAPIVLKG